MPSSLPPYLTSGASSRSHHALLVKLHEARSDQEEADITSKEIERLKDVMSVKGQSTARLADCLIILLNIAMIRHDTDVDLDFGLVHALHLAESGKTIQEKRVGYLYLQERMPKDHELGLMLINTIRKDLMSSRPSCILLALHTIIKMPSRDLAPAVTPHLTSKTLIKHKLPGIRQRVLEAICALHIQTPESDFPLSMSKLVRMLAGEEDESVLAVVIRTIRTVLRSGARSMGSEEEAIFLCEVIIDIANNRLEQQGQILLECLGTLSQIESSSYGKRCEAKIIELLDVLLPNLNVDESSSGAVLLEACRLLSMFKQPLDLTPKHLIPVISAALRSPDTSTSLMPYTPRPNLHVLVIRCFYSLPLDIWDGKLGDQEMGVLMEGLNSSDDTIRRSTLGLLNCLSPTLLDAALNNHLEALKTSSNLALPLDVPAGFEEKTTAGRLETSSRALEVVEIKYRANTAASEQGDQGCDCARAFIGIIGALNEGVVSSATSGTIGGSSKGQIWEDGLRRILDLLLGRSEAFATSFTREILLARLGSATLAVLRCTVLSTATLEVQMAEDAVQILLEDLADFGPSVQEITLVALVVLLSQIDYDQDLVIGVIQQVKGEAGKYIRRRCDQVLDLVQQDLIGSVVGTSKSRSIPDVLDAITTIHKKWRRSQRPSSISSLTTPVSPSRSIVGSSSLRYDAYDAPTTSIGSLGNSKGLREKSSRKSLPQRDHAIFDADEEAGFLGNNQRTDGRARPVRNPIRTDGDILDPFTPDEATTPTIRQSGRSRI